MNPDPAAAAASISRPSNPQAVELVRLKPQQAEQAARVLAEAFFDDPLIDYYLPDRARRGPILLGIMLTSVRYCLRYGEVWTTPGVAGVACWLPPEQHGFSLIGLAWAALGALPLNISGRSLVRMLRSESQQDRLHAANMPEPHWYLMLLGVQPAQHGQGLGSRLLAEKMAQIQAGKSPVYLETMAGRNVDFYRKRGFRVLDEDQLKAGGPHVWAMAAGLCKTGLAGAGKPS